MNLPTLPTQGPMRGEPPTAGSPAASILPILASESGNNASPAISVTTDDRSRMTPAASSSAGRSLPGVPTRSSFMLLTIHGVLHADQSHASVASPNFAVISDRRVGARATKAGDLYAESSLPRVCRGDFPQRGGPQHRARPALGAGRTARDRRRGRGADRASRPRAADPRGVHADLQRQGSDRLACQ